LIMRKGSVAPEALMTVPKPGRQRVSPAARKLPVCERRDMLTAIQGAVGSSDVVIATTGYTGRELYACGDRDNQIYMVGSMGCASSVGLGLAIARPDRRVIVIDGDGAALMHLGALCTIGAQRPENLLHIVLDNGVHESTGGQVTVSDAVDFCGLAASSGYSTTVSTADPSEMAERVATIGKGLHFVHAPIKPGIPHDLPRPRTSPSEVALRLRKFLVA